MKQRYRKKTPIIRAHRERRSVVPSAILTQAQTDLWETHLKDCESEIEKLFLSAYLQRIRADDPAVKCVIAISIDGAKRCAPALAEYGPGTGVDRVEVVVIQPEVGKFRPDFAVSRLTTRGGWCPMALVECDGHEFHDASKERAARDKSRDRRLQTKGFFVLRFTGSEIWNHAKRCAREVNEFLSEAMHRNENRT